MPPPPHPREPERGIQALCNGVRFSDFEKDAADSPRVEQTQHVVNEGPPHAMAPLFGINAEVQDFGLVRGVMRDHVPHHPAVAIGDEKRDVEGNALLEVALRPWVGEAEPLDRRDRPQVNGLDGTDPAAGVRGVPPI